MVRKREEYGIKEREGNRKKEREREGYRKSECVCNRVQETE